MKTIVVGVDSSASSRRAVAYACELAQELGARVVAVHAVGLLEHERGDPASSHLAPALDEWTAALEPLGPERTERRLVAGEPVTAVLHTVADVGASLVVVGSRGEGGRTGTTLGSTSLQLAPRCPVPVVIVGDGTGA